MAFDFGFGERRRPEEQVGSRLADYLRLGFTQEEALGWQWSGVDAIDAARWRAADVDLAEAGKWRYDLRYLQPWLEAGLTAQEAAQWVSIGTSVDTAVSARLAGADIAALMADRDRSARAADEFAAAVGKTPELTSLRLVCGTYELLPWLTPDAVHWARAGIDALSACDWLALGFSPAAAAEHEARGDGPVAALIAGWETIRIPAIEPAPPERLHWPPATLPMRGLRAGVHLKGRRDRPLLATERQEQRRRFPTGSPVAGAYLDLGWTDDDAVAWGALRFAPFDALDWMTLGITLAEAQGHANAGIGPLGILLAWHGRSIPAAEIADWLGAGLSASQAAAQRAGGVTVEQAKVLRLLRSDEEQP